MRSRSACERDVSSPLHPVMEKKERKHLYGPTAWVQQESLREDSQRSICSPASDSKKEASRCIESVESKESRVFEEPRELWSALPTALRIDEERLRAAVGVPGWLLRHL